MTTYHEATNEGVRRTLDNLISSRSRVRVFLGNTETGDAWPEEYDVTGCIGRSAGPQKVPLLVHSSRSFGGRFLLDHCVVGVVRTDGYWLYQHPRFSVGKWEHGADETEVLHNGIVHARFQTRGQAENYIKFMKGERFRK